MKKTILVLLLVVSGSAQAVLNIEITKGMDTAVPIAIIPFKWSTSIVLEDADISTIVASDLLRSGRFAPIPDEDLLANPTLNNEVHYKTWRIAGIDHLVIGDVQKNDIDNYTIQFRLIDIFKGEEVVRYSFDSTRNQLRTVAHKISDIIYERITGLKGAFNSRIAYVAVKNELKKGVVYRLQVADTDGYGAQTLLTSTQPIMSPVWSPDGTKVAYVSFEKAMSEIYTHDIHTGERDRISAFKGINGAPVWSPDGSRMAITLSKDGNPDIYIMSLDDKKLTRVTHHWAIDTEAVWTPDGEELVFTSNRSGRPQLYRVSTNLGARPIRLTFEGKYNANATVSNDGKMIAFVHGVGNKYSIAILYLESGLMEILTEGPLDESPEFSPNGSMILYASQANGKAILAAVSNDGRHQQKLILSDGEVREPSWAATRN